MIDLQLKSYATISNRKKQTGHYMLRDENLNLGWYCWQKNTT